MRFDIKLLGRLEATLDDVSIVPSASKPRQVLALLALKAGNVVSTRTLMAELWGDDRPRAASTGLHTYISNLRRELGSALAAHPDRDAKSILVTERTGYSLRIPLTDTDVGRYECMAAPGRVAAGRSDYETARDCLGAALALWRGSALSDLVAGSQLAVDLVGLEETRVNDLGLRIAADLHLSRHRMVLAELAELCARFPLSEAFCEKYMLALCRSGEQWRALQAFQGLRSAMIEALGSDPSSNMQRLHLAILRRDPAVEDPNYGADDRPLPAAPPVTPAAQAG